MLLGTVKSIDEACIAKSNMIVGSNLSPTLSDHDKLTSNSVNSDMRLHVLSGCYNILGIMTQLQISLKSEFSE